MCVRFVGQSPHNLKNIPLLVKVTPPCPFKVVALRAMSATQNYLIDLKYLNQIKYTVYDKSKEVEKSGPDILYKSNDPTTIPLISVDLNRQPELGYRRYMTKDMKWWFDS